MRTALYSVGQRWVPDSRPRESHPRGWASAGIPDGLVKNTFQVPLGQSRALEILVSLDVLGALQRLIVRYRLHPLLSETLQSLGVFSQIELSADKYDRDVGRMVVDLWEPLQQLSVRPCPVTRASLVKVIRWLTGDIDEPWP